MIFSSITFLYFFFPVVGLCYHLTPARFKNVLLLVASLLFYILGSPKGLPYLLIVLLTGYFGGLMIQILAKKDNQHAVQYSLLR